LAGVRDEIMSRAAATELDLAEVKGQASAKRALTIAAAGGHNMLMLCHENRARAVGGSV
jgi:magnesium chelatase family protein